MGRSAGIRPHLACKILLFAVGFARKGVVCSMDVASNRLAWQLEGGALVSLAEAFGEGASWELARALALRGERWAFDPSALGQRQRAAMRRRASRLVLRAAAIASGLSDAADGSSGHSLSACSRVVLPWVWHEAPGGVRGRRVGSAWLFAGDLPPLRRALADARLQRLRFHPDAVASLLGKAPSRLLPENLACSMDSFLDRSDSGVAPAYVWLPRWLVVSERDSFLASIVWALTSNGFVGSFGRDLPSGRDALFEPLPLVGGWPSPKDPVSSSLAYDGALTEFLNRREWALALTACAEIADLMEGFEHG